MKAPVVCADTSHSFSRQVLGFNSDAFNHSTIASISSSTYFLGQQVWLNSEMHMENKVKYLLSWYDSL